MFEGRRKVGVHYCFCSAPALGEAFENIVPFVILVSLWFSKVLGSFWAQMPGEKKDKQKLAKPILTYTYKCICFWHRL